MNRAREIKKRIQNPVILKSLLKGYDTMITGSRVFGGYDSKISDVDVLVYDPHSDRLFDKLMKNAQGFYVCGEYNVSSYYDSIYVKQWNSNKFDFILFNLLCFYDKQEFDVWSKATDIYKELLQSKRFKKLSKDKIFRVEVFEALKSGIKEDCALI